MSLLHGKRKLICQQNPLWVLLLAFWLVQGVWSQSTEPSGYRLWLDFKPVENSELLEAYRLAIGGMLMQPRGETQEIVWSELIHGLEALLSKPIDGYEPAENENLLLVGLVPELPDSVRSQLNSLLIPKDGFLIRQLMGDKRKLLLLTAGDDMGLLYGAHRLLRLMQTEKPIAGIDLMDAPKTKLRMLNHWDNLDRTVERGYAGASIWDWQRLPGYIDPRYRD